MSQWMHVNGSIRFDSIPALGISGITESELGNILDWEDDQDDDTILPLGSEGSMKYKIIKTGADSSLAKQAVIFWGDLRDYDDEEEIVEYFKDIVKDKIIRNGVFEVDNGYDKSSVYRYSDKKEWVKL